MAKRIIYILLIWLMAAGAALADTFYSCNFEDVQENANWTLNWGPMANKCKNLWYIGTPGSFRATGKNGLYVSCNNGRTAAYNSDTTMFVTATRALLLPEGDYDLIFDWLCQGRVASGEGLYVCAVPTTTPTYSASDVGDKPSYASQGKGLLGTVLNTSYQWTSSSLQFHSTGDSIKLVFLWFNATRQDGVKGMQTPTAACIDNINIINHSDCKAPVILNGGSNNSNTMLLRWRGNADWYDIRWYDTGTDHWDSIPHAVGNRVTLTGLSEGVTQVFIRSHCGESFSEYARLDVFNAPTGSGRCIDYLVLDATNCSYSEAINIKPLDMVPQQSGVHPQLHQLCYLPNELDYYSGDQLLTKPQDAIASVKLGRYDDTHLSRVKYTYQVPDEESAILKLRYAVVLPNPHPTTPEDNPIFYFDIFRNNDEPLDYGCGHAMFVSGDVKEMTEENGWHQSNVGGNNYWKDWTEVAINLRDYVGETLTIQLTTTGCAYNAHGGYAYFTLDCEAGELVGANCGEEEADTHLEAPAGFTYRWYLPDDPSLVLSTERTFTIPARDTLTYNVDVISLNNEHCYYTLSAMGIPRYPVAKYGVKQSVEDCLNVVTLIDSSYVEYKNLERLRGLGRIDTLYTLNERVTEVLWDYGDGTSDVTNSDSVVHVYPAEGGDFTVTMTASISHGVCTDQQTFTIHLPRLTQDEKDVWRTRAQDSFKHDFGVYDTVYVTDEGCELTEHVHVYNEYQTNVICQGGEVAVADTVITSEGQYRLLLHDRPDSILVLTVHVIPRPILTIATDTVAVCADEADFALMLHVEADDETGADSVSVRFSEKAQEAGFLPLYRFAIDEDIVLPMPENVPPDYYSFTVDIASDRCPTDTLQLVLEVRYPSSFVALKDGIIALYNEKYTGYTFSHYAWLRNGQLLEGEDKSYIVVSADDTDSEYSLLLTRDTDGVLLQTCPVIYNSTATGLDVLSSGKLHPSLAYAGQTIWLDAQQSFVIYDVVGRKYAEYESVTSFAAPMQAGLYILKINESQETIHIVVR